MGSADYIGTFTEAPTDLFSFTNAPWFRLARGSQTPLLLNPPFDRSAQDPGYIKGYPVTPKHAPRSHAEVVADQFVRERVDRAARHAPALFENPEVARDTARETQLLFDEKQRDARFAIEREQDVADLVHEVGLNPFG